MTAISQRVSEAVESRQLHILPIIQRILQAKYRQPNVLIRAFRIMLACIQKQTVKLGLKQLHQKCSERLVCIFYLKFYALQLRTVIYPLKNIQSQLQDLQIKQFIDELKKRISRTDFLSCIRKLYCFFMRFRGSYQDMENKFVMTMRIFADKFFIQKDAQQMAQLPPVNRRDPMVSRAPRTVHAIEEDQQKSETEELIYNPNKRTNEHSGKNPEADKEDHKPHQRMIKQIKIRFLMTQNIYILSIKNKKNLFINLQNFDSRLNNLKTQINYRYISKKISYKL